MLRIGSVLLLLLPFSSLCGADELTSGEVTIRRYSSLTSYTDYPIETAEEVVSDSAWNSSKPTVIFIHGMHEGLGSESVNTTVAAFIERGDWNVLALGYEGRATYEGNFITGLATVFQNVLLVGAAFATFIVRLVAAGVESTDLYLVGYNIGAHIAGHGARNSDVGIPRITALDPYIHTFYLFGNNDHLWSTDAPIVDVIHTNGVISSVATSTGTVDFYPNSGYAFQPGCSWGISSDALACSSLSSYKYYAESVVNPTAFPAISCDSWSAFQTGSCNEITDYMGYGYGTENTGDFFLQTESSSPYSKGDDGVVYNVLNDGALSAWVIEMIASWLQGDSE